MMKTTWIIFGGLVTIMVPGPGWAAVRLPKVFSDHMVLQREAPVKLWGWAEQGEQVVIEFSGQKHSVVTDREGRWQAALDPMPPILVGWSERKDGETIRHPGALDGLDVSRVEADEMIMAARLAAGWVTEEDLLPQEEEADAAEEQEEEGPPPVLNVIEDVSR